MLEQNLFEETKEEKCQEEPAGQRVSLVGIGMGNPSLLTGEARLVLDQADCIIGAKRALEAVAEGRPTFCSLDPEKILSYMKEHPQYREIVLVLTGDPGLYSGAKKLFPLLEAYHPRVYPGISSLQYFCAKLGLSWDDAYILSLHGRQGSPVQAVAGHEKVFILVGGAGGVKHVLEELCGSGLDQVWVSVGERLSYPEERILTGTPKELCTESFDPLSVLLIQNPKARSPRHTANLSDTAFLRKADSGRLVPMTREEIRAVSIAKLMLEPDSVVYDIGAGMGAVSVEMAGICTQGQVYAIEGRPQEAALARKNKQHFGLVNLTVVEGWAPQACLSLPAPTHAFIGGNRGNIQETLKMLLEKNSRVRVVINLAALESIGEALGCMEEFQFRELEIIQVSVAKAKKLGPYHLLNGQNPITIITCQK